MEITTESDNRKFFSRENSRSIIILLILLVLSLAILYLIVDSLLGPAVSCEMVLIGQAGAWLDENENGKWEDYEKPLIGVDISYIAEFPRSLFSSGDVKETEIKTNNNGTIPIYAIWSCNVEPKFSIVIDTPEGYKATTPLQFDINDSNCPGLGICDYRFLFGFSKIE